MATDRTKRPDGIEDNFAPGADADGVVHTMTMQEARADAVKRRAMEQAYASMTDGEGQKAS